MKRSLSVVAVLFLLSLVQASAQTRFGITGGLGWNQSKISEIVKEKPSAGWCAGITMGIDLPLGFSLQPTLRYHQKNALVAGVVGQKMEYVELPVSVQWGPDLLVFRPFLDVTPYVGYAFANETFAMVSLSDMAMSIYDKTWDGKQRLEYGLGLGGGIEVWRFQVAVRYNWNLGQLYNVKEWDDIKAHLGNLNAESENFSGVSLDLSFFF